MDGLRQSVLEEYFAKVGRATVVSSKLQKQIRPKDASELDPRNTKQASKASAGDRQQSSIEAAGTSRELESLPSNDCNRLPAEAAVKAKITLNLDARADSQLDVDPGIALCQACISAQEGRGPMDVLALCSGCATVCRSAFEHITWQSLRKRKRGRPRKLPKVEAITEKPTPVQTLPTDVQITTSLPTLDLILPAKRTLDNRPECAAFTAETELRTRRAVKLLRDQHGFEPNPYGYMYHTPVEVLQIGGMWLPARMIAMRESRVRVQYTKAFGLLSEWMKIDSRRLRLLDDPTTSPNEDEFLSEKILEEQDLKINTAAEKCRKRRRKAKATKTPNVVPKPEPTAPIPSEEVVPLSAFQSTGAFMTRRTENALRDPHGFGPNVAGHYYLRPVEVKGSDGQWYSGQLTEMDYGRVRVHFTNIEIEDEWVYSDSRRLRVDTKKEQRMARKLEKAKGNKDKEEQNISLASMVFSRRTSKALADEHGFIINSHGYHYDQKVEVLFSDGLWYDGVLTEMRDDKVKVHYTGWTSRFDQWIQIESRRIRPINVQSRTIEETIDDLLTLEENPEMQEEQRSRKRRIRYRVIAEALGLELVDPPEDEMSMETHDDTPLKPPRPPRPPRQPVIKKDKKAIRKARRRHQLRRQKHRVFSYRTVDINSADMNGSTEMPEPRNVMKTEGLLRMLPKKITSSIGSSFQSTGAFMTRGTTSQLSDRMGFAPNPQEFSYLQHVLVLHIDKLWYEARLVAMEMGLVQVHFCGWPNEYDEWIAADSRRIQQVEDPDKALQECVEADFAERIEQRIKEREERLLAVISVGDILEVQNCLFKKTYGVVMAIDGFRILLQDHEHPDREPEWVSAARDGISIVVEIKEINNAYERRQAMKRRRQNLQLEDEEEEDEYYREDMDENEIEYADSWQIYCNQCHIVIKQFRYYCMYCESPSFGEDYASFELCLWCFSHQFPDWHEHPRSGFAVQSIMDDGEQGPVPVKGELVSIYQKDTLDTEYEGNSSSDDIALVQLEGLSDADKAHWYMTQWKKRKVCVLCNDDNKTDFGAFIGPFLIKQMNRNGQEKTKRIWVHDACARFSPDVFITKENEWYNVAVALQRGRSMRCWECKEKGATFGCFESKCDRSYHLPCTRKPLSFFESGAIFWCPLHEMRYRRKDVYEDHFSCDGCAKNLKDEEWHTCRVCGDSYFTTFDLCTQCFESPPSGLTHNHDWTMFEKTCRSPEEERRACRQAGNLSSREGARQETRNEQTKISAAQEEFEGSEVFILLVRVFGYDGVLLCEPCFDIEGLKKASPEELVKKSYEAMLIESSLSDFYVSAVEDYTHQPYLTRSSYADGRFDNTKSEAMLLSSYEPAEHQLFSLPFDTTYFDIPGRAPRWASHSGMDYHGTWLPQTVRRALEKFTQKHERILSNFLGRGTDAIECFILQRRCIGVDINPAAVALSQRNCSFALPIGLTSAEYRPVILQMDSRNLRGPLFEDESFDHILSHPPYKDCVAYSTHIEGDLSRYANSEEFLQEYRKVCEESRRLLKHGKRVTLGIGDNREHCFYVPVGFHLIRQYMNAGFELEELIVKRQRYCSAYGLGTFLSVQYDFLCFTHEFIATLRKAERPQEPPMRCFETTETTSSKHIVINYTKREVPPSPISRKSVVMGTVWVFKPTQEHSFADLCMSRMVERFGTDSTNWVEIRLDMSCDGLNGPGAKEKYPARAPIIETEELSEYEMARQKRIADNNRTLLALGLVSELSEDADDSIHLVNMAKKVPLTIPDARTMLCVVPHIPNTEFNVEDIPQYRSTLVQLANEAALQLPAGGMFITGVQDIRGDDGRLWPLPMLVMEDIQERFPKLKLKELIITVPHGYSKDRSKITCADDYHPEVYLALQLPIVHATGLTSMSDERSGQRFPNYSPNHVYGDLHNNSGSPHGPPQFLPPQGMNPQYSYLPQPFAPTFVPQPPKSKAIKIINPNTLTEVPTESLRKASPAKTPSPVISDKSPVVTPIFTPPVSKAIKIVNPKDLENAKTQEKPAEAAASAKSDPRTERVDSTPKTAASVTTPSPPSTERAVTPETVRDSSKPASTEPTPNRAVLDDSVAEQVQPVKEETDIMDSKGSAVETEAAVPAPSDVNVQSAAEQLKKLEIKNEASMTDEKHGITEDNAKQSEEVVEESEDDVQKVASEEPSAAEDSRSTSKLDLPQLNTSLQSQNSSPADSPSVARTPDLPGTPGEAMPQHPDFTYPSRILKDNEFSLVKYPSDVSPPTRAPNGVLKMSRDFIMQFRELCLGRPTQMPSLDGYDMVDLSADGRRSGSNRKAMSDRSRGLRTPSGKTSEERFQQSMAKLAEMGKFAGGKPLAMRSMSGGGAMGGFSASRESSGRSRSGRGGKRRQEREQVGGPTIPLDQVAPLEMSENRWKPALNSDAPVQPAEGELIPMDILTRKVKSLLNKLTMEKFESISSQICDFANQSVKETNGESLRTVIQLVFEKATDEPNFAKMWAQLCRAMLDKTDPEIYDESAKDAQGNYSKGPILFRKYLLNRCQTEFEKGWKVDLPKPVDGADAMLTEEYYIAQKAKRRGLGLVQLIGELFILRMLTERIMHACIKKLLANVTDPEEEEMESLCKLLITVGKDLDTKEARSWMNTYFDRIKELSVNETLSSRIRFQLLDVIELREHHWIPRNGAASTGPKTISEIHEEAQQAKMQQEREAAKRSASSSNRLPTLGSQMSRSASQRARSDRSGPPTPAAEGQDGWSTVGGGSGAGGTGYFANSALRRAGDLSQLGKDRSRGKMPTFSPGGNVFSSLSSPKGTKLRKGDSSEGSTTPVANENVSSTNIFDALGDADGEEKVETVSERPKLKLLPRGATKTEEESLVVESPQDVGNSMSKAEVDLKVNGMMEELWAIRDLSEFLHSAKELSSYQSEMIKTLVTQAIEKKSDDVTLAAEALRTLNKEFSIESSTYKQALSDLVADIDDISIDVPSAYQYAGRLLDASDLSFDDLVELEAPLLESTMLVPPSTKLTAEFWTARIARITEKAAVEQYAGAKRTIADALPESKRSDEDIQRYLEKHNLTALKK
ncbi:hypothetical protein BZG36_00497 [Bifiguratus adelaidae]|uniref:PHD-type domain-containing protein n=1 Tax=Bifiguratus adelaidae TaxID=1938954 RepID=A0A261Y7D2_9FUNG|nr:hypothetical protein BZG36_00497 [Bifiguratus adelaidae]